MKKKEHAKSESTSMKNCPPTAHVVSLTVGKQCFHQPASVVSLNSCPSRFGRMRDRSPGGICCLSERARRALNMCYREKTFHIRAIRSAIMVSVPQLPLNQRRRLK